MSFKTVYETMQTALRGAPDGAGVATFMSESRQVAGFRSQAQVRQFQLTVDEPEELGGSDTGPNPVELVLAALGTCQEITYRLYADAMGIPLRGVSVKVEGDLDPRGFFAVDGGKTRPGYRGVRATVTLDSSAPEADLKRLRETVDRHCPVLDIIRNPVPVDLTIARGTVAA